MALVEQLRAAWEQALNDSPEPVRYTDALMALHNFHKMGIMDLATHQASLDGTGRALIYRAAADTFMSAMQLQVFNALDAGAAKDARGGRGATWPDR
jgi:hypothetical protein